MPDMADKSLADGLADPMLLETIDKLFQHNIGEYVSLPQVCSSRPSSSGMRPQTDLVVAACSR